MTRELLESFEPFPALETPRLSLRRPTLDDAAAIFHLQSDAEVGRYFGRPTPTRQQTDEKLALIDTGIREHTSIVWVLSPRGARELWGTAGFWRWNKEHHNAELGYALLPAHWGGGLMAEALRAILAFGFARLALHRAEANVDPDNAASRRVLEKLGFVQEGLLRENWCAGERFTDTVTFGLLERDLVASA